MRIDKPVCKNRLCHWQGDSNCLADKDIRNRCEYLVLKKENEELKIEIKILTEMLESEGVL